MSRDIASANLTAAQSDNVRPVIFVEMQFDEGTERMHNALGDIVWGGYTWSGIGDLGVIGEIEESESLSPYAQRFQLNAMSADLLALAESAEVFDRAVIVYLGLLNDSGALAATPQTLRRYYMDNIEVTLGSDNDSITLTAESEMRFLDRTNGAKFTDEWQQSRYSGDVALEFMDQMQDAVLTWGPAGRSVRFTTREAPEDTRLSNRDTRRDLWAD